MESNDPLRRESAAEPQDEAPAALHARIVARSPMLGGSGTQEDSYANELLELCRERDEDQLKRTFPGRLDFYRRVATPPIFTEEPVDAVVVIGISGNLVAKARRVLENGLALEALKVQVRTPGTSRGFAPNRFAQQRNTTDGLFQGHYTPSIERMMEARRHDCDTLRNSAAVQGACRRDLTVSITREWLESRGHQSVRVILSRQTAWPEFATLFKRELAGYDVRVDSNFDHKLPRGSTFIREMCGPPTEDLWMDYEFYVRTLMADG